MATERNSDFRTDHLNDEQKAIAEAIIEFIESKTGRPVDGGGCTAFYTPKQWEDRGEQYGLNSVMILCHDGGCMAPFCNWDYDQADLVNGLISRMAELGYWLQPDWCWSTSVYRLGEDEGTVHDEPREYTIEIQAINNDKEFIRELIEQAQQSLQDGDEGTHQVHGIGSYTIKWRNV